MAVCPVDKRRDDECRVAGCLGTGDNTCQVLEDRVMRKTLSHIE